jgi:hypothetical protein
MADVPESYRIDGGGDGLDNIAGIAETREPLKKRHFIVRFTVKKCNIGEKNKQCDACIISLESFTE